MQFNLFQQNIMSNVGKKQSFTAVNEKFLKIAKEEYSIMNTVSGDTIELLQHNILTKKITAQDGIDTIDAIKPLTKKKYQYLYKPLIDFCNRFISRSN